MSCLGVLFAVEQNTVEKLKNTLVDDRPDFIAELEGEMFENFPERVYELDKSWDAMHRLLTDGTLSFYAGGMGLALLGGQIIYYDEPQHTDYIITAKAPQQVKEVSKLLDKLSDGEIRRRYFAIPDDEYGEYKSEEDYEYTYEYLTESKTFWHYAAENGLWVLFTADQ